MGLEILARHGVCCVLHISYPRYRDQLDPALLGFDLTNTKDKAVFKAPSISLLADALKPVQRAEAGARHVFIDNTLSLHYGTGLRFCPAKGLHALMTGLKKWDDAFNAAVADFVDAFPATIENMKKEWKETMDRQLEFSETVRTALLNQVIQKLPRRTPNVSEFGISTAYLELKTPETPGFTDVDDAEAAVAAEAWHNMKERAEADARRFGQDFIGHCKQELMERLHAFFSDMQKLVELGKPINKRTVEKVRDFLATVQTLNFTNDSGIADMAEQLKSAFGPDFTMVNRVENEDVIASVKNCLDQSLKLLGDELASVHDDGGSDRIGAVLGTVVPNLSSQKVEIEF